MFLSVSSRIVHALLLLRPCGFFGSFLYCLYVFFARLYTVIPSPHVPIHKSPRLSSSILSTKFPPIVFGLFSSCRYPVKRPGFRSRTFNPPPSVPTQRLSFESS